MQKTTATALVRWNWFFMIIASLVAGYCLQDKFPLQNNMLKFMQATQATSVMVGNVLGIALVLLLLTLLLDKVFKLSYSLAARNQLRFAILLRWIIWLCVVYIGTRA